MMNMARMCSYYEYDDMKIWSYFLIFLVLFMDNDYFKGSKAYETTPDDPVLYFLMMLLSIDSLAL